MLLAHPELADGLLKTWRKVADMCGFLLIQAHPFRKREYIPDGNQMPQGELLDGIEVFNSCNTPQDNEQAQAWSKQHPGKILTAGADAHAREIVCVSGMEVERRIQNERALAEILRTGSFRLLET